MLLLDNAPRQCQPYSPTAGFAGYAGLEQLPLHVRANARTVVAHRETTDRPHGLHCDPDAPTPATQRVDGVLDDDFERPLDEHRITRGHRSGARRDKRDRDLMREPRQPRPGVRDDAPGNAPQSHRLAAGPPSAAAEAFGHAPDTAGTRAQR